MTEFTFDDVLLLPQYSDIRSRSEVSLRTEIGGSDWRINLELPIVAAPMSTVCESAMAGRIALAGGAGIIHRYMSIEDQVAQVKLALEIAGDAAKRVGAAIGATGDYLERFQALKDAGVQLVCIDVAHGHHISVKEALAVLRPIADDIHLMTGNIATAAAYRDLSDWGSDSIRVGVGGGATCTTRIGTGHGRPNAAALLEITAARALNPGASVVLDGGVRTAGDIVKAIAFGADAVMCGRILAGTDASPGDAFDGHKNLVGMASLHAQREWAGRDAGRTKGPAAAEGVAATVPFVGSLESHLHTMAGLIRSGLSYSGARSAAELRAAVKYVVQTQAGQRESRPHALEG